MVAGPLLRRTNGSRDDDACNAGTLIATCRPCRNLLHPDLATLPGPRRFAPRIDHAGRICNNGAMKLVAAAMLGAWSVPGSEVVAS